MAPLTPADPLPQALAAAVPAAGQSTAQMLIAVGGVVVGLLVGLGAPWLTAALARDAGLGREQHAVADRILRLWERPEGVKELLAEDLYGTRRSLLLMGNRLRDKAAREACLLLVHKAARGNSPEDELIDSWSDMVQLVSRVYRRTAV